MRPLAACTCLLGLHGSISSQPLGDAYWNKIVDRADSVVISRFGAAFFMDHIFSPIDPLDYIVIGEYSYPWDERDTISRLPESCYFEYDIGFDSLHASRMNIAFGITPAGELIEDEDLRGFVEQGAPAAFHNDLNGFVELARKNGVKCERHTAFRELRWMPLDTAAKVHPDGIGRYELVLGRIRKKKMEKRVSYSTYTYQILDAIVFDPFTGAVLRKEERWETLSVACGVGNL